MENKSTIDIIFNVIGIFIIFFPFFYFIYYILLGIFYKIKNHALDNNTLKMYIEEDSIKIEKTYTNKKLKKLNIKKYIKNNVLYLNKLKFNQFFGLFPYSLNIYLNNIENLNIKEIEFPEVHALNLYFYEGNYKNSNSNYYKYYINFDKVNALGLFFENNVSGKLELKEFFEYNRKKYNIDNIVLNTFRIDNIKKAIFTKDTKLKIKYGIKFQYIDELYINNNIYEYDINLIEIRNIKYLDLTDFFQLTEKIDILKIENVDKTNNFIYRNINDLELININIDKDVLKIKNCKSNKVANVKTLKNQIVIDDAEYIYVGTNNLNSNIIIKNSGYAKLTFFLNADDYVYIEELCNTIELLYSKIEELGFIITINNLKEFLLLYDKLLILYKKIELKKIKIEKIDFYVYDVKNNKENEIIKKLENLYDFNHSYEDIYNESIKYCENCLNDVLNNKEYDIIYQLPFNIFLKNIPKFKKISKKEQFKLNDI